MPEDRLRLMAASFYDYLKTYLQADYSMEWYTEFGETSSELITWLRKYRFAVRKNGYAFISLIKRRKAGILL